MNTPQLTKPASPVPFAGKSAFIAFLERHGVPLERWGERNISKAWREVEQGDALYSIESLHDDFVMPIRHIRTVTARITHEYLEAGFRISEVLRECQRVDGQLVQRKYEDSSLSEKMKFGRAGQPDESPECALQRAFLEELGIRVPKSYLGPDHLVLYPPRLRNQQVVGIFPVPASSLDEHGLIEIDDKISKKFAGLHTRNELVHYIWRMPEECYRAEGYQDPGTKYVMVWDRMTESPLKT